MIRTKKKNKNVENNSRKFKKKTFYTDKVIVGCLHWKVPTIDSDFLHYTEHKVQVTQIVAFIIYFCSCIVINN